MCIDENMYLNLTKVITFKNVVIINIYNLWPVNL